MTRSPAPITAPAAQASLAGQAVDRKVHPPDPPRRLVALLAVDGDLGGTAAMRLDEPPGLHEQSAEPQAGSNTRPLSGSSISTSSLATGAGVKSCAAAVPSARANALMKYS